MIWYMGIRGGIILNLLQKIEFEKYQLPNGLDVILHKDHTIPLVAVNIWYHVGSKNEKRGRTGFAHLFEHLMFQGSEHHNYDYFEPLEKIGGAVNGSTNTDRTNYWENVPSNYLELALWLESDRMGFLLPAMTQERLDNQRDVVKNERRQGIDNQPYGKSYEILLSMLYPQDHPYSWSVIGSMDDLSAASLEDVSQFFRTFYSPNNASLCIAGDFDRSMAKEMAEKYFASIPPGPPVDRVALWIPEVNGVKRTIAEDNVNLGRVYYSWHTPKQYTQGDAELEILDNILVSGKSSRLYKSLVYEKQIAHDVEAYQHSCELGSSFNIYIDVKEGRSPEEIEDALNIELEKVFRDGVTQEELEQAKTAWEVNLVRSLEQIGGFGGRADKLNKYNVMLGDPGKLPWDIKRFSEVKVDQIQQYARQYLDLNKRVILHIVPQGELKVLSAGLDRSIMPEPLAIASYTPPRIQRDKLSNGLEIFLVEDHKLPLIQLNLALRSGQASDLAHEPDAASLTAELLDEGTRSRTAIQIAEETKRIGADLDTSISFDGSYVNLNILKRNLEPGLELMSDIILNPTFPEEELERQREIYLGNIQQESKQPVTLAYKVYMRKLYGANHPYGRQPYTGNGTAASIKAMKREYLMNYYKSNYVPNNAVIAIAGDITMEEAKEKLEKFFGSWRPAEIFRTEVPDPTPVKSSKVYIVDRPGSAQSVIVAGNPGIRRNSQDYIACSVMNNAFGGQFTSRLNMNLREDKGYTYGASSFFHKTRGVGSFMCFVQVQTQVTKEAIAEIIKEIKDIVISRPLTDDELIDSKNNLVKGFPQQFQSHSYIASRLTDIFVYDILEDDWYSYISRVNSVDSSMTTKVAMDHLHPDALVITVVGDSEKIKPGIQELGLEESYLVDTEGNPV
jgi:zinc protease